MARVYIELSDVLFHLTPGEAVQASTTGPGFAYIFTDHDRDWSIGLADIQGPVKFAESLLRRELRGRRELSEGDRIWLYRVRKHGDRFQAIYGILSGDRYETLQRRYLEQPDGMAMFDGVSVALGLLKQARPGNPKAVIVQVADAAIVAMGDNRHCHWMVRMAVQDDTLESILERVQAEAAWRKISLHGIDVVHALAGQNAPTVPAGIGQWLSREYSMDGQRIHSDLEALLPRLPLEFGPVTRQEAVHRPLERAEPLAWIGLVAAALGLFFYGVWMHGKTRTLHEDTAALQARAATHDVSDPRGTAAWSDLSRFHEQLGPALKRPLAGDALLRLSRAIGDLGLVEVVTLTEQDDGLSVYVYGGVSAGLDAGSVFQRMLLGMTDQGFIVQDRQLEIGPQETTFVIEAMLHGTGHAGGIAARTTKGG